MLRNYFKSALRNLFKNRTFTFVNVLGLAIGIASTLLINQYVRFERSYESMHANADNIFRITLDLYNGSEFVETDCETYQLLGPELEEQMPEVLGYARFMNWDAAEMKVKDKAYFETGIYMADISAFGLFTYDILYGDPVASFSKPFKIVLTENSAKKYFGRADVIGETMQIEHSDDPLEVVGVIADLPQNTHLKFDMLISHATIPKYESWYLKNLWGSNNEYTYLLMEEGTSVEAFNKKLYAYCKQLEHPGLADEMVVAEKIQDIHLYSHKTFEPEVNGNAQAVNFMSFVAILIMVIAWVNYVNLSTARATERAKEVGIRKAVGSTKSQLITQFLLEALMVNMLAAFVAYTMVQLAQPFFQNLTGQQLVFDLMMDQQLWVTLSGIILLGTALAGIYPALVLSSFRPAAVLKGKFKNSSFGLILRKGLIIFQFGATVVLMAVSIAVYRQIDYMIHKDLDIDISNTMVIRTPNSELSDSLFYYTGYQVFKDKLEATTDVKVVAQAAALPAANNHEVSTTDYVLRVGADHNEGSVNYYAIAVDEHYFTALGLDLVAGNNFKPQGNSSYVIINERAVQTLGFENAEEAVGQKIHYGGDYNDEILAVVNNYHQRSPKEDYVPMLFRHRKLADNLVIKFDTSDTKRAMATVEATWKEVFSNSSMDFYFLDDKYNQQYQSDQQFSNVTLLFTVLSIVIACMGLFGLSSFMLMQRTKEIGIRKVLGASVKSIVQIMSKDFLKLVVIAGLLAIPVAYFIIDVWLGNYANRLTIGWDLLIVPFLLILLIALVTVIGQILKSAVANPVDSLKYE
jgi:putative ABC transport system permease protein